MLCVQDKICTFFLPLSVITQVMNLLKGIWRHHLLSKNSCPLILDNNNSKFSAICVRFLYKYLALCYFFPFFNRTPFVFFKGISSLTLILSNIMLMQFESNKVKWQTLCDNKVCFVYYSHLRRRIIILSFSSKQH